MNYCFKDLYSLVATLLDNIGYLIQYYHTLLKLSLC